MKLKKCLCGIALLIASSFALTGCTKSAAAIAPGDGSGLHGVELKLSHGLTTDHPVHIALSQFADEVAKETDGDITVKIFPNAVLGSEKDNLEQITIGALDMCKTSASALESFASVYEAFSVPYLFNSQEHFYSVMDSDIAQDVFMSTEDKGFVALTWLDSGSRSFYTKNKPINTPADLKGLKIRTMDSPMAIEMMKCFGGSSTAMPIADVFTGIQSGVIDGAENNETAMANPGSHGDIAKFYSYDEHTRIPDIIVINAKVWNSFTPEQQTILRTAADNAKETYKESWNAAIAKAVEMAENDKGVTFVYPEKEPFQEAVKPIYDKLAKDKPEVWSICERIQNYK